MPYRTNIAYTYDGSFSGLLCCIHESYYAKELPAAIFSYENEITTIFPVKEITTNEDFAQKVENSIISKISHEALHHVRYCYLSCAPERELIILNFLRLSYKTGRPTMNMLANDAVRKICDIARNVSGEAHKYKGFLRFSEHNGALAAIIEPKNFILPLLAPHFCDRFPAEQLLIYDKTHKHAFIYEKGQHHLLPLENFDPPPASESESTYRALWQQFYNTIAIPARLNPNLRQNHMPKRYWRQMTEFK